MTQQYKCSVCGCVCLECEIEQRITAHMVKWGWDGGQDEESVDVCPDCKREETMELYEEDEE